MSRPKIARFRCKKSGDTMTGIFSHETKRYYFIEISGWSQILDKKDWELVYEKSTY